MNISFVASGTQFIVEFSYDYSNIDQFFTGQTWRDSSGSLLGATSPMAVQKIKGNKLKLFALAGFENMTRIYLEYTKTT